MAKRSKLWSSAVADKKFSKFIRERDGKCMRCGKTENLQCSHFWARANSAVRYDPLNCITLCYRCHYGDYQHGWEYEKQGAYREYMLNWLRPDGYAALEDRARSTVPRAQAIKECMELLKQ